MRVLFFAQLKDATGCDSVEIAPASPLNAEQLWAELLKKFPKLAALSLKCPARKKLRIRRTGRDFCR